MNRKIALVTGASSGIGKALCQELLDKEWTVIGIARSKIEREEEHFFSYICDVSKADQVKAISEELLSRKIIPSLFFLNAGIAGIMAMEPEDSLEPQIHHKIFDVNYFGVLYWISEWEKPCQESGGASFMVTSSVNAFFAPPGGSAYAASKSAIAKAFEGLQLHYANTNLKFLVAYPGPVDTPGLVGKMPFTWKSKKMANYLLKNALKANEHNEPSRFYSFFCKAMPWLPKSLVLKILGKPQKKRMYNR